MELQTMICNDTPVVKQNKVKPQSCFVALLNQIKKAFFLIL